MPVPVVEPLLIVVLSETLRPADQPGSVPEQSGIWRVLSEKANAGEPPQRLSAW